MKNDDKENDEKQNTREWVKSLLYVGDVLNFH